MRQIFEILLIDQEWILLSWWILFYLFWCVETNREILKKKKILTPKLFIEEEPYVLCDIGRLYIRNIFRIHFKIFFWRFVIRISSHPRSVYLSKVVLSKFFLSVLRIDRNILPSTASLVTSPWTHPNLNHLRGIAFPPTSKSRIEIIIQCDPYKQE